MKTKPKYFHITVNAGCEAELKKRVDDDISRGFEVVAEKTTNKSGTDWDVYETYKRQKVYTSGTSREHFSTTTHSVLMRRDNRYR